MKSIKPYTILWVLIPILFVLHLFGSKKTLDIQMHDTYYIIRSLNLTIGFAFCLAILGGVYWLLRNFALYRILSLLHVVFTALCIIGLYLLLIFQSNFVMDGFGTVDLRRIQKVNSMRIILVLTLIIFQIMFATNVLVGLIKGKRNNP